jgi:hypothetical protein
MSFRSSGGSQTQSFSDGIYNTSQSSGKKKSGAAGFVLFGAVFAIAGIGAAAYFLIGSTNERSYQKDPVVIEKPIVADTTSKTVSPKEEPVVEKESEVHDPHYIFGEKLYRQKDYDLAQKQLEMVPKTSDDYNDAQLLLKNIKLKKMKKEYEEKMKEEQLENTERNSKNDRNRRPAPVQPVR